MKNKIKLLFTLIALSVTSLASCNNNPVKEDTDTYVTDVSLNVNSITLEKGQYANLQAIVYTVEGHTFDGQIQWISSNKSVATVNESGLVVAIGEGRSYVSAIAGYRASTCVVNVIDPNAPIGDAYIISENSVTIRPGTTKQLYTTFNGESVSSEWSTNNASVATVNETGLVTAIQAGKATIKATYENAIVECNVTVSNDAPEQFTISISPTKLNLLKGATAQLNATTSKPADITWSSENENIITVDNNGLVTAIAVGSTYAVATANDKVAKCFVEVSEGEDEDKDVTVYFFLDYNNVDDEDTTGTKLVAKFKWYQNVPLKEAPIPANPTQSADPAFPYFVGWSAHTIIDSKADLWDMEKDVVSGSYHLNLYGIWSDTEDFSK